MESKIAEFVQLTDQARELAQTLNSQQQSEHLNLLIRELERVKSQALAGQLEPSGGTVTLGLARQVADQVNSLDSPLLTAVGAVERYYQENL